MSERCCCPKVNSNDSLFRADHILSDFHSQSLTLYPLNDPVADEEMPLEEIPDMPQRGLFIAL